MKSLLISVTGVLVMAALSGVAVADRANDAPRGERRGPPAVAVEACAAAVQGDVCSFEGRESETVNGTCETPPRNDGLVCFPEGGPPDHADRGSRSERGERDK